jgi:hypothetical protein
MGVPCVGVLSHRITCAYDQPHTKSQSRYYPVAPLEYDLIFDLIEKVRSPECSWFDGRAGVQCRLDAKKVYQEESGSTLHVRMYPQNTPHFLKCCAARRRRSFCDSRAFWTIGASMVNPETHSDRKITDPGCYIHVLTSKYCRSSKVIPWKDPILWCQTNSLTLLEV